MPIWWKTCSRSSMAISANLLTWTLTIPTKCGAMRRCLVSTRSTRCSSEFFAIYLSLLLRAHQLKMRCRFSTNPCVRANFWSDPQAYWLLTTATSPTSSSTSWVSLIVNVNLTMVLQTQMTMKSERNDTPLFFVTRRRPTAISLLSSLNFVNITSPISLLAVLRFRTRCSASTSFKDLNKPHMVNLEQKCRLNGGGISVTIKVASGASR